MVFGKLIPGLKIHGEEANYPVLNERSIRATAGIMMLIGIITFFLVIMTNNYRYLYVVVVFFWIEFFIRTVFGPRYSPLALLGGWTVKKQNPDWVGAIQKRFARGLGLAMATAMIIVAIILQIRGIAPFAICMTCLFFMWLESALGICVGCKIYYGLINIKILPKPENSPACPGGSCSIKK